MHAVVVRGAGGRAFCAGGDVRAVWEAGRGIGGDPDLTAVFFREEYRLIREIHRFPKPYIAIIDGITMGGGAGISVNGAYRLATERTLFAMPETAIGLFPDVGATRFLNRCPGQIGRYLGLSGARLRAADALYCGLATHVAAEDAVEAAGRGARPDRVASRRRAPAGRGHASAVGDRARTRPARGVAVGDRPLLCRRYDRGDPRRACGRGGRRRRLRRLGRANPRRAPGEIADQPQGHLAPARKSARDYDLDQALILEYRLTQHMMAGHDFYEGVRAALIDKDQKPRWRPATLAEIDEAMIDAYFAPLGDGELNFDPAVGKAHNRRL